MLYVHMIVVFDVQLLYLISRNFLEISFRSEYGD